MVYGVQDHIQQYFSYIVAVSSIGGRNKSTRRKPLTCHKSLANFNTAFYIQCLKLISTGLVYGF